MKNTRIGKEGLVLLGCGKMGSAMLAGWLARGLPSSAVWVVDPNPSDWLRETGVHLNEDLPEAPGAVLVAVKPQMMAEALPTLKDMGGGSTVFVSVAAGVTLETFERMLGADTPIVRAMPNTPAAISKGITAIVGNAQASSDTLDEAEALLSAVGDVVRLTDEAQINAVTGVSGSGPAYVFHMMEAMAAAGEAEGLPRELALQLATATMAGACALAQESGEHPSQLRQNVTSPNGTTQAALEVLMDETNGLAPLMRRAVSAATQRSKELASG
jgi:pyrroline-5-carboxylate reductase